MYIAEETTSRFYYGVKVLEHPHNKQTGLLLYR